MTDTNEVLNQRCSNCRFCVTTEDRHHFECHRYAPRRWYHFHDEHFDTWITVSPDDWCGDYQRGLVRKTP